MSSPQKARSANEEMPPAPSVTPTKKPPKLNTEIAGRAIEEIRAKEL